MEESEPATLQRLLARALKLRADLAAIRLTLALRRANAEAKYNPNWARQPRAPRGAADGGQWVDGGGGGKPAEGPKNRGTRRPPSRGLGDNRPPSTEPPPLRPHVDWGAMSNQEYFAAVGQTARQRESRERMASLEDAIRSLDPSFRPGPIVTLRGRSYEGYLVEQLHIRRVQVYGPLGMERAQWTQFKSEVSGALRRSRFPTAEGYLRGSAVSGVSFRRGPLDQTGPRDFDAAIVSPHLFEVARNAGVSLRGRNTRTVPLSAHRLAQLGLPGLPQIENGRPVTYVVFRTSADMRQRPGLAVPISE